MTKNNGTERSVSSTELRAPDIALTEGFRTREHSACAEIKALGPKRLGVRDQGMGGFNHWEIAQEIEIPRG